MGAMQRNKGQRGEREVRDIYTAAGIPCQRLGNAGRLADLAGLEDYGIWPEVKMQGSTDLPGWMRQAEAEAGPLLIPVVHWRLCRRGNSTGWYVNLPLADFIPLLQRGQL